MEKELLNAALKMYHNASGNIDFSVADVCDEFSRMDINDKSFEHGSPIGGLLDSYIDDHTIENELHDDDDMEDLLAEVLASERCL